MVFSTHFYTTLVDAHHKGTIDMQRMSRWYRDNGIFTKEFIIIPIYQEYSFHSGPDRYKWLTIHSDHWFLAIITNLHNLRNPGPDPSAATA